MASYKYWFLHRKIGTGLSFEISFWDFFNWGGLSLSFFPGPKVWLTVVSKKWFFLHPLNHCVSPFSFLSQSECRTLKHDTALISPILIRPRDGSYSCCLKQCLLYKITVVSTIIFPLCFGLHTSIPSIGFPVWTVLPKHFCCCNACYSW